MSELSVRHPELDPDRPTVCICHHGIRSASVAGALENLDFTEFQATIDSINLALGSHLAAFASYQE